MPNLTNKKIDGAKPKAKPYKLSDAHGLYIEVLPSGSKSWRYLYKLLGKHKTKTYGKYPDIGLADARLLHNQFRIELTQGIKESPSFDTVKTDFLAHHLKTLKNAKHKQQVQYRLDEFVSPIIGKMAISTIKRTDLVNVVKSIQAKGVTETAHRVGTHIRQLFDYALDIGLIEAHSANGLSRVLDTPKTKHMNCIPVKDAGRLFKAISGYDEPITRIGLQLAALTFVRTNELRFMTWDEIQDERFWVIPAERMKMKKPHVVPLSDAALKLLKDLEVYTGDYDYVLNSPKRPKHPVSENTLLFALYRLGYRGLMTVHGFRALASTVLNEQSPFSHDVIERQLAHKETDLVRAAYNRAEYLDERIKLMDWWSSWVANAELSCETI
jgi:integrase